LPFSPPFGEIVGDLTGSMLSLRGISRFSVNQTAQALLLIATIVPVAHVSLAKAAAVAVVTRFVGILLPWLLELLFFLYLFGVEGWGR
jgi:hypothetical protein